MELADGNFYDEDMRKSKRSAASTNPTREKLAGLPFSTTADLNAAIEELRMQMWRRLENARLFNELSEKEDYRFIKDEFRNGLTCNYGNEPNHLVKVFSDGSGVKIDINKDLVKEMAAGSSFVEAMIRSMGDTFSKSYYQAKGILPPDNHSLEDAIRELQRRNGSSQK